MASNEGTRAPAEADTDDTKLSGSTQFSHSPIEHAEAEAQNLSTAEQPLGPLGPPLPRRSPFLKGMTAAAGVAVTYGLVQALLTCREVLVLVGLALFLAVGLEPLVVWLVRRGFARWAAVLGVLITVTAVVAGFLAAALSPLIGQANQFAQQLPGYLRSAQDPHSTLGELNTQFAIQQHLQQFLSGNSAAVTQGILGAGQVAFSALGSTIVVLVLGIYFLATMPSIRTTLYRLVPASRRPRAVLLGDQIFTKIGGYVLGNVIVSLIAGTATFVWLLTWSVPYSMLLAVLVALLDFIPVAGSMLGGVIVSLVALTVSGPVALATAGFFLIYRVVEDYLLMPKIIEQVIRIPSITTILAILFGGTLLGVLGALVAIPLAAMVLLLLREIIYPRMDRT